MKKTIKIAAIATTMALLLMLTGALAAEDMNNTSGNMSVEAAPMKVGGECTYDHFAGTAKICSINQTNETLAQKNATDGPGYAGFLVKYEFKLNGQPPIGMPAYASDFLNGCENILLLGNSWYPGEKYLQKYNITEGATFRGNMSIIRSGTCTPVLIRLDGIDIYDYSE
jgi:hypothetical protein